MTAPRAQLRALTGVRFVAALHVVVFHCVPWATWDSPGFLRRIAGTGYVAVSLFFVLSGFILAYAHADARPSDRSRFYVNRFARVYPAYLFALALVAPFYVVHTLRTEGALVLASRGAPVLVLLQAWLPSAAMAWNPPGWSLSAEAFFYAIFPFVAPRVLGARLSTAVAVGVGCQAVSLLVPLAYVHFAPDGPIVLNHATMAFWLNVVRYDPLVRAPELVIGIVSARVYLAIRGRAWFARLAPVASTAAVVAIVAVLVCSEHISYPVLHNGLLSPLFALLIVGLTVERGPVAAVLATRPLVALGDASYSLYLIHIPLLIFWSKGVAHLGEHVRASGATTAAFVACAVGASLLCHRHVELPARRFVLRRWSARAPSRSVVRE